MKIEAKYACGNVAMPEDVIRFKDADKSHPDAVITRMEVAVESVSFDGEIRLHEFGYASPGDYVLVRRADPLTPIMRAAERLRRCESGERWLDVYGGMLRPFGWTMAALRDRDKADIADWCRTTILNRPVVLEAVKQLLKAASA